ncbi:MAG: MotA/TolQ/ExbB proton channel family protein [Nitrospiria bacterium]
MLELYLKGGFLMHPILVASVIALAVTLERLWYFWFTRSKALKARFERVENLLSIGKEKEAAAIAATLTGPIGSILQLGLNEPAEDPEIVAERMAIRGEEIDREAAKGLALLGLIPPVSTMLGLLGTVVGMVLSFQRLSLIQGALSPALLASGIWVALITTVSGMAVAIPALIAHYYLQGRKDRLVYEIEHYGSRLLVQLRKTHAPQDASSEKPDFNPEPDPFRYAIEEGKR